MPELLTTSLANGVGVTPAYVAIRLLVALLLGAVVAWIYTRTSTQTTIGTSFPLTLALLAVLIAMVTQVIGDNVARAFSLVGALSIVRFRTVVRDTKDTAYVIFAVVVGMAIGAQNVWVALIGIGVIGAAAFITMARGKVSADPGEAYLVTVRLGAGFDPEQVLSDVFSKYLRTREVMSVNTARQGTALDITYAARLHPGCSAQHVVMALNRLEGVQEVRLQQRGFELNGNG